MATYSIPPGQNKFIFIFAGIMLAAGALWFGYRLLDGKFLSEKDGSGPVVGKEHVPASEQYRMQNVGGVNRTVKIAVPEAWLLEVDLGGTRAKAGVDAQEFRDIQAGDRVKVRYVKRRLSGNLQVTRYLGKEGE